MATECDFSWLDTPDRLLNAQQHNAKEPTTSILENKPDRKWERRRARRRCPLRVREGFSDELRQSPISTPPAAKNGYVQ